MNESEKLAVAAHLHVLLRRKVGRVTDVVWAVRNLEYAREVIRVARGEPDAELREWADKLEVALLPPPPAPAPTPAAWSARSDDAAAAPPAVATDNARRRYVGRLR